MIDPLRPEQIAERIRVAARQASAGPARLSTEAIARGELPPVPEPLPAPPAPNRPSADQTADPAAPESSLDIIASMVPRALNKVAVNEKTPSWLRPLLRNQGGFNHILLDALDRLVEVNRQLQRQNQELHGRLAAMQGWMNAAASHSGQEHDWMLSAENRLRGLSAERLARYEERLARLEEVTGLRGEKTAPSAAE